MLSDRAPHLDPALLAAANINPVTGLATDYLNHFNEVAMLVDMVESMPEVVEDILAWRPRSYGDHFHVTGFRDKDLAIEAYEAADAELRAAFEAACDLIADDILDLQEAIHANRPVDSSARAASLYASIAQAGRFIEGGGETHTDQADIDALFD